jgi:hypothetical protein
MGEAGPSPPSITVRATCQLRRRRAKREKESAAKNEDGGGRGRTEDGTAGTVEGVVGEVALLPLGLVGRVKVVQRLARMD